MDQAGATKDASTQDIADLASSAIAAAVAAHVAAADPHEGYLTPAEGDAAYVGLGDARLSDARTPTAHKSTHATGGADALTPADIGAATSAQGDLADSAVQPGDLATVATSGAYADLSGRPTIPAAADAAPAALAATAAIGTSTDYAREDHAHQRDSDVIVIPVGDESTALTTGMAKISFRMPFAATLLAVRASVNTAATGSTLIVDINEGGTSVLGTKLSIDAGELTSTTAASAPTITDSSLADDALITIDIDQIGSTVAGAGLKVSLFVRRS